MLELLKTWAVLGSGHKQPLDGIFKDFLETTKQQKMAK
jgi:hypothetical protein